MPAPPPDQWVRLRPPQGGLTPLAGASSVPPGSRRLRGTHRARVFLDSESDEVIPRQALAVGMSTSTHRDAELSPPLPGHLLDDRRATAPPLSDRGSRRRRSRRLGLGLGLGLTMLFDECRKVLRGEHCPSPQTNSFRSSASIDEIPKGRAGQRQHRGSGGVIEQEGRVSRRRRRHNATPVWSRAHVPCIDGRAAYADRPGGVAGR